MFNLGMEGADLMDDRREIPERRAENIGVLAVMQDKINQMHGRLYNGLGKEIRQEVKEEISGLRNLVVGILIALVLALAGIVIEGRVSSNQSSIENAKTYKAIIDVGSRLENHIITTSEDDE